jgi:hypothetical protein
MRKAEGCGLKAEGRKCLRVARLSAVRLLSGATQCALLLRPSVHSPQPSALMRGAQA